MSAALEALAKTAVDCGFKLHEALGPGLLASVYEACLCEPRQTRSGGRTAEAGSDPVRRVTLEEGFRVDLLAERQLLIELKSTEAVVPVHAKQVMTYLRVMDLPLGLLMNFGVATFRDGVRRIAHNSYAPQA